MVSSNTPKVEITWDQFVDSDFPTSDENTSRRMFREAVEEFAEKARQALPDSSGRIDCAIKIVLAGDVEPLDDGTAKVGSQSNGTTTYFLVDGQCECRDYEKAPQNFCKHLLAYGLFKRATSKLAQQHPQAVLPDKPITPQAPIVPSLPEAPASCNCYVEVAGRRVQITLRDADEARLLSRLEALLSQFPVEASESVNPPEGWCSIHQCQMKPSKDGKGWYHKAGEKPDGKAIWCRGK